MDEAILGVLGISALLFFGAKALNKSDGDIVSPAYPGSAVDNSYDTTDSPPELSSNMDSNISSFLYMIRCCEHVYPRDVINDDCYFIFFGGGYFENDSDHPVNTGEKTGIPLPPATCIASGYKDGKCVSTAAGAYQFIRPTWNQLRSISPRLNDFSMASQDEAAVRALKSCGAYQLILNGDISGAINKASKLWASLPGSAAKQNPKPLEFAIARFNDAGLA